jgi:hypothetical protein
MKSKTKEILKWFPEITPRIKAMAMKSAGFLPLIYVFTPLKYPDYIKSSHSNLVWIFCSCFPKYRYALHFSC